MRNSSVVCLILLQLCLALPVSASPLYHESFDYCLSTPGREGAYRAGWVAYREDVRLGKPGYLKVYGPGSDLQVAPLAAESDGGASGNLFWSKETHRHGLYIFTTEKELPLSDVVFVDYEQRLDGIETEGDLNDGTRLALLVDGIWYLSQSVERQDIRGRFEYVTWSIWDHLYQRAPHRDGFGPATPKGAYHPLPENGTLQGFGVYLTDVTGRVRLDNYALHSSVASEVARDSLFAENQCSRQWACPQLQLVFRNNAFRARSTKRRRLRQALRRTGVKKFGRLKALALLGIIENRSLSFFAVNHLKVGDLHFRGTRAFLSLRSQSGTPREHRVRISASKALRRYLRQLAPTDLDAPLFPKRGAKKAYEPLCSVGAYRKYRWYLKILD
jgi:hypothetical protein